MSTGIVNQFELHSPAKINLFLELIGRRDDGFHELVTVISPVSIFDTLTFRERSHGEIRLSVQTAGQNVSDRLQQIPADQSNIVWRALELFRNRFVTGNRRQGIDVQITKRIPAAAGLGGASGNAAAALVAARQIWNPEVSDSSLNALAAELGSDVPVFLGGRSAVCTGRGENVSPVDCAGGIPLVIAQPPVGLSTAGVYSICKVPEETVAVSGLLAALKSGSISSLAGSLFNRLEEFASTLTQWIDRLRYEFSRVDCPGHQMTGSGSAYFGAFSSMKQARIAAARLSSRMPGVTIFPCRTLQRPVAMQQAHGHAI